MTRSDTARSRRAPILAVLAFAVSLANATGAHAAGTCTDVAAGLHVPMALAWGPDGSLLVSEAGTPTPNSGRVSVVYPDGGRRTLIDGLPSGVGDVGDPSGPAGMAVVGRTLYLLIGAGDAVVMGRDAAGNPVRGSDVANPAGPSSPNLSSVLAIQFSGNPEFDVDPFVLTADDQRTLALGLPARIANSGGHSQLVVWKLADFPDYVPVSHPLVANAVQHSNPFGIVAVGNVLYVTDGGRNLVWRVSRSDGTASVLASFPDVKNPLFASGIGGPVSQAVPTGIAYDGVDLLVTLFRGAPFAPGLSTVEAIDPLTGEHEPWIDGLKTAIGVLPRARDTLVLQHSSGAGPFFPGPGVILGFDSPSSSPAVVADCLAQPSAMLADDASGMLLVTEVGGKVRAVDPGP